VELSCNRRTHTGSEQSDRPAAAIVTYRGKTVRNDQTISKVVRAQSVDASLTGTETYEIQKLVATIQRKLAVWLKLE